jgi:hypothetical protein
MADEHETFYLDETKTQIIKPMLVNVDGAPQNWKLGIFNVSGGGFVKASKTEYSSEALAWEDLRSSATK